jgi:phage gp46-like protein
MNEETELRIGARVWFLKRPYEGEYGIVESIYADEAIVSMSIFGSVSTSVQMTFHSPSRNMLKVAPRSRPC